MTPEQKDLIYFAVFDAWTDMADATALRALDALLPLIADSCKSRDADRLAAENERLREALRAIARACQEVAQTLQPTKETPPCSTSTI